MHLSDRELATVLAALRHWQQALEAEGHPPFDDHFQDGATPLTPDEIDDLCERLNCGPDGGEPHVVVFGHFADGFCAAGPFPGFKDAAAWCNATLRDREYLSAWIALLLSPA